MRYVIIEGKNNPNASEYLLHELFWTASGIDDFIIIPTEGNQNVPGVLKNVLSKAKLGDEIFLAYDVINASVYKGRTLLNDILHLVRNCRIPCYFLRYDSFEFMLLVTTIPYQLTDFMRYHISDENMKEFLTQLCRICDEILLYSDNLAVINWNILTHNSLKCVLNATIEQRVKLICMYMCNSVKAHFNYTESAIGECWHVDCNQLNAYAPSVCKQHHKGCSTFSCSLCNITDNKAAKLMQLLNAKNVFDLYFLINSHINGSQIDGHLNDNLATKTSIFN